ncbi:hypothetical protein, conserved, partial [Eimeria tenella]
DGSGHFNNLIRVRPAAPSQFRLIRERLAKLKTKRIQMERSLSSPALPFPLRLGAPQQGPPEGAPQQGPPQQGAPKGPPQQGAPQQGAPQKGVSLQGAPEGPLQQGGAPHQGGGAPHVGYWGPRGALPWKGGPRGPLGTPTGGPPSAADAQRGPGPSSSSKTRIGAAGRAAAAAAGAAAGESGV